MNNGNNNNNNTFINNNHDNNDNNNNLNNLEFLPQVNNFELPTDLTKPFEDETDSDMALDSDDEDYQDFDDGDDSFNSDGDQDIQDLENGGSNSSLINGKNNSKSTTASSSAIAEKKTPNAFILFAMEKRKQLKRDHPDLPMAAISQILGKEWKELHPNDKKVFTEKAASMRESNKNSK